MKSLLSVQDLAVRLRTDTGPVDAVRGVSFTLRPDETLCLVGESGSGKTVTCETITGINPDIVAATSGRITFDGIDLLSADECELRAIRGSRIAHIFQNPENALDPVYTVGDQIIEALTLSTEITKSQARKQAIALLQRVGIPRAAKRIDDYPHQFSTGMSQRVAIAIALAPNPDLLIADEPTASLDVTVQARILRLLASLHAETEMAILLITHDLRVVATLADTITVLQEGYSVEWGSASSIFDTPAHPYTQALFESTTRTAEGRDRVRDQSVPSTGCSYAPSCPYRIDACHKSYPAAASVGDDPEHQARCIHYHSDYDAEAIRQNATTIVNPHGGT